MFINELYPGRGSNKRPKRVGRGPGSGHGKTATRGHKGHQARAGYKYVAWKEGGQMPLQRRLPKRGFTNIFRKVYQIVNLADLSRAKHQELINPLVLKNLGLIKNAKAAVKILGNGTLAVPLKIQAHAFSKNAQGKIARAGGTFEILK